MGTARSKLGERVADADHQSLERGESLAELVGLDRQLEPCRLCLAEQDAQLVLGGDVVGSTLARLVILSRCDVALVLDRRRALHLLPLLGESVGEAEPVEAVPLDADLAQRAARLLLLGERLLELPSRDQLPVDQDRADTAVRDRVWGGIHISDIGSRSTALKLRGSELVEAAPSRSRGLCDDERVAHIRLIEPEDASGLLAEEYDAAVKRAGKVYNIVKSMSLQPGALRASMGLYRAIMFGPSPLTRQERELLATVVSATNECYY